MEGTGHDNIFQKLKSLTIPIPKDLKDEFYSRIAKENLVRVMIISIIYLLFEIMIIFIDVDTIYSVHEDKLSIFIVIFHVVFILISYWLRFKKKHINGMITQGIIYLYCFVLVYWSIDTSLGHIDDNISITMFILTLMGTSAFFYRRTLVTLITNFGLFIYFALNIKSLLEHHIMMQLRNLPSASMINSMFMDINLYIADVFLITVICCVLAIIVYRLRLKVFLEKRALEELALKDSMTNLLNHKTICNSLKKEITRSKRTLEPVSILMTDIDHFKKINDTYGHQVGDQVIIKIAKLLTDICRETDYVGRYGGEEFLIVLTDTNSDGAKEFSERFRKEVEKTDFGIASGVTVSGGVKNYENESAEEMIKIADGALYQAKENGRNCVIIA
ncbi:GGDEF domain-containing protein [Wukongibacter baidiensis]|uniref:GGDEF domain-containing protein n=1 Tax=Wukongibacter baidiensis TaxID=1723361 RepID=UPI003D7F3BBE